MKKVIRYYLNIYKKIFIYIAALVVFAIVFAFAFRLFCEKVLFFRGAKDESFPLCVNSEDEIYYIGYTYHSPVSLNYSREGIYGKKGKPVVENLFDKYGNCVFTPGNIRDESNIYRYDDDGRVIMQAHSTNSFFDYLYFFKYKNGQTACIKYSTHDDQKIQILYDEWNNELYYEVTDRDPKFFINITDDNVRYLLNESGEYCTYAVLGERGEVLQEFKLNWINHTPKLESYKWYVYAENSDDTIAEGYFKFESDNGLRYYWNHKDGDWIYTVKAYEEKIVTTSTGTLRYRIDYDSNFRYIEGMDSTGHIIALECDSRDRVKQMQIDDIIYKFSDPED